MLFHTLNILQVFWCQFPKTEFSNEFGFDGKRQPAVVISKINRVRGTVVIVPFKAAKQTRPEKSTLLKSPFKEAPAFAVCCHSTTVSTCLLIPEKNRVPSLEARRTRKDSGLDLVKPTRLPAAMTAVAVTILALWLG
ncbi:MAG: type II toxin-antitoxin system PemK/MazF family toxin [Aestuariivita sp.]|nr:type II toxin-antitoxin system PemK/MazF family toxin [Aestuariivita sp.]MCY4203357.1 type II toxin-antitoxin system PemK/MazF family toxin [Aestuariivita sp.]